VLDLLRQRGVRIVAATGRIREHDHSLMSKDATTSSDGILRHRLRDVSDRWSSLTRENLIT